MTRATPGETGKKQLLVKVGVATLTEKGLHNTAIDELVAAAGVPKGSFTYYFGSKDAYALEVIGTFGEYFSRKLDRILLNKSLPALDRLRAFGEEAAVGMEKYKFRRGCLVGNLGQEVGALDEKYRIALLRVLEDWRKRIQTCIEDAQHEGSVSPAVNAADLARLFWFSWEGAVLGAKLEKSRAPLTSAIDAFIALLRSLEPQRTASKVSTQRRRRKVD